MELNQKTLKKAYSFLSKDERLKFLIDKFSDEIDITERYNDSYPMALAFLIIEQQVSFRAAITIKKRFINKVSNLSNDEIINLSDEDLQSIGISYRKVEYIKNVFKYFKNLKYDFDNASNDDVVKELIKIKGIGIWSAEMFSIFVLFRINIFSKGDLALMNSIKRNYNIDIKQTDVVDKLIYTWSPYKTVASLLLWKSIEEGCFY